MNYTSIKNVCLIKNAIDYEGILVSVILRHDRKKKRTLQKMRKSPWLPPPPWFSSLPRSRLSVWCMCPVTSHFQLHIHSPSLPTMLFGPGHPHVAVTYLWRMQGPSWLPYTPPLLVNKPSSNYLSLSVPSLSVGTLIGSMYLKANLYLNKKIKYWLIIKGRRH